MRLFLPFRGSDHPTGDIHSRAIPNFILPKDLSNPADFVIIYYRFKNQLEVLE